VWRELQQTNQKLLDLKKELSELERVTTPVWQRGRFLENTELARRRREIRSCQERILKLEAEWRQLQDTARRLGLAPGLLRGTH
jgi:chromosome segregation ATPase